jgi:hypothetical protein
VLTALASAFHSKAMLVVKAELGTSKGKPAVPENGYTSVFETRMRWSKPPI